MYLPLYMHISHIGMYVCVYIYISTYVQNIYVCCKYGVTWGPVSWLAMHCSKQLRYHLDRYRVFGHWASHLWSTVVLHMGPSKRPFCELKEGRYRSLTSIRHWTQMMTQTAQASRCGSRRLLALTRTPRSGCRQRLVRSAVVAEVM